MEGLLATEAPGRNPVANHFIGTQAPTAKVVAKTQPSDLKPLLAELHVAALNRAKTASNPALDMVARLAVIKFLRIELNAQFAQVLERCRMMLKSFEGVRQQKAMEYRERVAAFQVSKKIIQRKAAQELFTTLREIEKETRIHRSSVHRHKQFYLECNCITELLNAQCSSGEVVCEHASRQKAGILSIRCSR